MLAITHVPCAALGAGTVAWSHDGSYVLTRCDSMPSALWVWDTARLELAALLQQAHPVKCAEWDPASNRCEHVAACSSLSQGVEQQRNKQAAGTAARPAQVMHLS